MSLLVMILVISTVISGSSILRSSRIRTETAFLLTGQASQFARSGLTDAINWFRRQDQQPVLIFAPQLDTAANPQVLDTEDPAIGLVRDFRIHGTIWGRYEVWKRWDADPDATRLAWRQKMQVEDVSEDRGREAMGTVWRVRCAGYIYDKRDASKAYDERPNRVMATEILEAEISRMSIMLPGQAAICSRTGAGIEVKTNGRLFGGSDAAGAYYLQGTGTPSVASGGQINGVPPTSPSSIYVDTIKHVFGVDEDGLRSMADNFLQNDADFPVPVPAGTLTVLENGSSVVFTNSRPLVGSGVVVIRNSVTINPGTSTIFTGLIYVEGNLIIHAPARIRGAIVVTGTVSIQGVGDFADVIYDDGVIDNLQRTLANYRMSRSARRMTLQD